VYPSAKVIAACLALFATSVIEAAAQTALPERQPCTVLGLRPDAVLQQCDDKLRSLSIIMKDVSRTMTIDGGSGGFTFVCPVEMMCNGEPVISGWLIDPRRWGKSPQDEDVIFSLVQAPPAVLARRGFSPVPERTRPKASCDLFDLTIAGLPGKAVCYEAEDQKSSGLFAIVANDEMGFVLTFRSRDLGSQALREKVLTMAPRFQIEVATGDSGLFRWMR
jgi:hypothetical protein